MMYPLKLKPIYDETIWGNNVLTKLRGVDGSNYGTSWEISAHEYCQNEILNGVYQGENLQRLIATHPQEMLGNVPKSKMLRSAFLDAKDDLSIQVHPNTGYAQKYEHDYGKTECWYVLKADPGATLVAGTKTSDPEVIRQAVQNRDLEKYLEYHPIQVGDFIEIDAGMLHALGGGILAIEVGTNSNTTYRFYDYGRKDAEGKERELHLDKSFDVANFNLHTSVIATPLVAYGHSKIKNLIRSSAYTVDVIDVVEEITLQTKNCFHCLTFVHNGGSIEYQGTALKLEYTDSVFVPAACDTYTIKGNCRVLRSYVDMKMEPSGQ